MSNRITRPDALLAHSRLRFILGVVLLPLALPLLAWSGMALRDDAAAELVRAQAGMMAIACALVFVLLALPKIIQHMLDQSGKADDALRRLRVQGQLLMLALQLIALSVWLPLDASSVSAGVASWAVAVIAAFAFCWLLAGMRSDELNPAALSVLFLALLLSARPAFLFGAAVPPAMQAGAGSCAASVWSGTGLCLLSDHAVAGALLLVVLALLIDLRRWLGPVLVFFGLSTVGYVLYAPLHSVDPLLAASAVVLIFPGLAYRSLLRAWLAGALWIGGFALGGLLPGGESGAAGFWLLGLALAELGLPLVWLLVRGLRGESRHL